MNKAIEDCLLLNKSIKNNNLVKLTWGNASVLSDDGKSIAIKPSGVDFNELTYSQICIIELYTGSLASPATASRIFINNYL